MANDREASVTIVNQHAESVGLLITTGAVQMIVELSGPHAQVQRALASGTPGSLYPHLDADVAIDETGVWLMQRSIYEGPGRMPHRRCKVRLSLADWNIVLARMRAICGVAHQ